ncbi:LysR family transcriptional regulator [Enterococcus sp. AZ103]|uniref:LysR family transcriptional regulator n=1 Tax=Enterococcus sp. AZ103 TaxID=2774628 RepID=UPI003F684FCA
MKVGNDMDMNIQKYIAFVKTVQLGSFTKAAQLLNYSQSGISRMIHDLEKDWGVTLLERNRAGLRLTSDGLKIFPLAEELSEQYQHLQNRLEELTDLQTGTIRIGTFSSVATHWLPEWIADFNQKYPAIEFELLLGDYQEIEQWIIEGRVDFGFLRLPTLPALTSVALKTETFLAVLPKDHPLTLKKSISKNDLVNYPFILQERKGNSDIIELFQQEYINAKIQYRTWDDYSILAMVENNLGISILPELILNKLNYQVTLRPLDFFAQRQIGLVYKNQDALSLASKVFIANIKKELS